MEPLRKFPPDTLYEDLMHRLLSETSRTVYREKRINRKKPDFLVQADDGFQCVVECTTVHWEELHTYRWEDGIGYLMVDHHDPQKHNHKLRRRIARKVQKYDGNTFPGYGVVIAVHNWSLFNDDSDAVEACFGRYDQSLSLSEGEVVARGRTRALDPKGHPPIFEKLENRHCSAIIHSTSLFPLRCVDGKPTHVESPDARHLLIPNPYATHPVPEGLFSFCDVLDLSYLPLPSRDGSIPTRKPLA